jgi:hypothetical protein
MLAEFMQTGQPSSLCQETTGQANASPATLRKRRMRPSATRRKIMITIIPEGFPLWLLFSAELDNGSIFGRKLRLHFELIRGQYNCR